MALWRPKRDNVVPPPAEELQGWNRLFMRGAETPYLPAALLAGSVYYIFLVGRRECMRMLCACACAVLGRRTADAVRTQRAVMSLSSAVALAKAILL